MPTPTSVFTVSGIEPDTDPLWYLAGEDVRRAFWQAVVGFVLEVKDKSLAKGLDRYGKRLTPIKEYTRKHRKSAMGAADPNAPPLTPAYGKSRTRAWLKGRAYADRAQFFWTGGWGRVLNYHTLGKGHLPVRDVVGLSDDDMVKVKRLARGWWVNRGALAASVREQAPKIEFPAFRVPQLTAASPKSVTLQEESYEDFARRVIAQSRARTGAKHYDVSQLTAGAGADLERYERLKKQGLHSGYTQFRFTPPKPDTGLRLAPQPPAPKPKSKPVPTAAKPPSPKSVAPKVAELPKAPEPPRPTPPPRPDLPTFADRVLTVIAGVEGEGRFGSRVFISHAYEAYNALYGPITLDEFKAMLLDAIRAGLIQATRADLVEAMSQAVIQASETTRGRGFSEYHLIRLRQARP